MKGTNLLVSTCNPCFTVTSRDEIFKGRTKVKIFCAYLPPPLVIVKLNVLKVISRKFLLEIPAVVVLCGNGHSILGLDKSQYE